MEPLLVEEANEGDWIQVLDVESLPEHYRPFIDKQYKIKRVNGNSEVVLDQDEIGGDVALIDYEFALIKQSKYNKHKRQLNI